MNREHLRTAAIALRNIALGGNLRALGRLQQPRTLLNYCVQNLFLYNSLFRSGLPPRNIRDVLRHNCSEDVTLFLNCTEFWICEIPSAASDLISLCLIARFLKPKRIFEIGTLNGYTTLHLAANAPHATVYTLDLPAGAKSCLSTTIVDDSFILAASQECFQGRPEAERIIRVYGDSATFDFSSYAGLVDFFFIDGAHSYQYVRNDTERALSCCHAGSVIAWHDYGRTGVNGVSRYLHELARRIPVYRVPNGSLAFAVVP
jgi:predicted O-methyltransferase YrrM